MSDYLSEVFKDTPEAVAAGGVLVPEEQDLANALIEIADKYGKFNEDQTGIWADYHEPEDNPYAEMGVKCGNCVLYRGGQECAVVAFKVDPEGYCRFAVLPDGSVDPSKAPEGTKPYEDHEVLTATAGSKPAPKKDRIKGSDKNKKGSAATGKGVEFTAAIIKALENKVKEHNEKAPNGRKVTLAKLKAVYRRGAGAFSSSHRPDQNRNSWAMARVNAFLKLVRSGKPNNPKYTTDNDLLPKLHPRHSEASTMGTALAAIVAAMNDDSCPPATQDIELNLTNRQNAIDNVGYGPLNPAEPNEEFWQDKADRWKTDLQEAKSAVCGNCIFFVRTPKMLDCIENGIGLGSQEAEGSIEAGELGYCNALDFKCASERTCNAWAAGGPITEEPVQASASPCWDGYKQVGMKKKDGKMVPNCVPEAMAAGGYNLGDDINVGVNDFFSKPVYNLPEGLKEYTEEEDEDDEYEIDLDDLVPTQRTVNMRRVEDVFDSNKPIKVWINEDGEPEIIDGHHRSVAYRVNGDRSILAKVYKAPGFLATAREKQAKVASGGPGVSAPVLKEGDIKAPVNGKKLRLPMRNEIALRKKVLDYNTKNPQTPFTASVDMLKAVYRRGAGTYNGGEFSSQTRDDWSMNRVDAFLSLLANGQPANAAYTQDFDLLPIEHPKSTRGTASLTASAASDYSYELAVELMNEDDYESQEHAIHVLAEFSGLGYDVIPAIRAAWLRGLKNEENPYERAAILATALYSSPDADLLPKKGTL